MSFGNSVHQWRRQHFQPLGDLDLQFGDFFEQFALAAIGAFSARPM
jgi:hypothetical protein